ncbi:MAG: VCBS repeat-containing protein [Planctomycetes bacterium]|nr:VCBS repeat-containing protein [Planctomycetota bacterium]
MTSRFLDGLCRRFGIVPLALVVLAGLLPAQTTAIERVVVGNLGDNLGTRIAPAGDFDGDGVQDVLASAPFVPVGASGQLRILSGLSGAEIWQYPRTSVSPYLGRALACPGDLNGDGIRDILTMGFDDVNGIYVVHAISGASGATLYIIGGSSMLSDWGDNIVPLEDLNGDGAPEFLLSESANLNTGAFPGVVTVYSGANGNILNALSGPIPLGYFGRSVVAIDDVDGDGVTDLAICGTDLMVMCSGATLATFYSITGSGSQTLRPTVARVSDLDGDGLRDFAIGTSGAASGPGVDQGGIQFRSSASGLLIHEVHGGGEGPVFGTTVMPVGDHDGDGFDDVATTVLPTNSRFASVLISGANGAVIGRTPLKAANITSFQLRRYETVPLGDINLDGRDEFARSDRDFGSVGPVPIPPQLRGEIEFHQGRGPVLRRVHSGGLHHDLDLFWIPDFGSPMDLGGTMTCSGAVPFALAGIVVSTGYEEWDINGYIPMMVSIDPIHAPALYLIGCDAGGGFAVPGLSRQNPALAGQRLNVQVFVGYPQIVVSNGLDFEMVP